MIRLNIKSSAPALSLDIAILQKVHKSSKNAEILLLSKTNFYSNMESRKINFASIKLAILEFNIKNCREKMVLIFFFTGFKGS